MTQGVDNSVADPDSFNLELVLDLNLELLYYIYKFKNEEFASLKHSLLIFCCYIINVNYTFKIIHKPVFVNISNLIRISAGSLSYPDTAMIMIFLGSGVSLKCVYGPGFKLSPIFSPRYIGSGYGFFITS